MDKTFEYDEKYFYANVLGDCEVTFITKDNQIVRCHTTRLNELDGISISELVKKGYKVALTCFEKDYNHCHRYRIAKRLNKDYQFNIINL